MKTKYFYYISDSKVRMLSAQFSQKKGYFGLNPKIEIPGFTFGVDYKSENVTKEFNPIDEITPLLRNLQKNNLLHGFNKDISNSFLVEDTDIWHHGLTESLHLDGNDTIMKRLLTYAVWKRSGRDIYLLFGSPTNILGEKTIGSSHAVTRVSTQILRDVQSISVKASLQYVFENTVLNLNDDTLELDEDCFTDIRYSSSEYKITNKTFFLSQTRDEVTLPSSENYQGRVLVMYCNEILSKLPKNTLNLVFKVFQKIQVNDNKVDSLYLGSPVYTALS